MARDSTKQSVRRGGRVVLAAVCFAAVTQAAPPARAASQSPHALRVVLDAPRACASPDKFWEALHRDGAPLRRAEAGEQASTVYLRVVQRRERSFGELRVVVGATESARRTVSGASCREVVSSMALMAALAFDEAFAREAEPLAATPPPEAIAPIAAAPVDAERATPPPAPSEQAPPRWRVELGAHATALALDRIEPGPSVFVGLARDGRGASPTFRVGATRVQTNIDAGVGHGAFTWTLARVEACPLRLFLTDAIHVAPCALVQGGALASAGEGNVAAPQSSARPWIAPGADLRLSARLGDALAIELEAGAVVPVVRDRFLFGAGDATRRDVIVWTAPAVVPMAGLGVALRLP